MIDRREFLKLSGATALASGLPLPLVHAGTAPRRATTPLLVSIYLRGGQDALNTIVPFGDERYYELRPTIAIPAESEDPAQAVVPLDKMFGLHPALAALQPLWQRGVLAPIVCTGSPHPTRSHFDAQDFMEYAAPGSRSERDGWLNRYLALGGGAVTPRKDEELRALAMQGLLPRALRGGYPVLAVPAEKLGREARLLDEFEQLYGAAEASAEPERSDEAGMASRRREAPLPPDQVKAAGQATVRALRRYEEIVRSAADSKTKYPKSPFAGRLRRIAQVVRAGAPLEVACVDYGGWDHHIREGGPNGVLAPALRDVATSLAAFAEDLGEHFARTLIVTMTEFGRTCAENGNAGTDHGHGGAMLLLGGKVQGGRVLGTWRGLRDEDLYEGRDLPVTTDFRDVMAEILTAHMGVSLPAGFFPDHVPGKGPGAFERRR